MEGSDTGETVTRIGDPDPYRVEWLEKARGVIRRQRRRKKRSEEVPREETKRLLVTTSTWENLPFSSACLFYPFSQGVAGGLVQGTLSSGSGAAGREGG